MNLHDIRQTAFAKWLLSQDEKQATLHLWECLSNGPENNLAFELWFAVHGEREIHEAEIMGACREMLHALKEEAA